MYFFYIFIQRYTFHLLIFLWTDTKLIVNLELREKFTRWKKPESFMITRAKLSAVRANSFVVVEQFTTFSQFWCHCLRIGGAALIRGRRLLTFLSQMRRLFEGGAYSSKYGIHSFISRLDSYMIYTQVWEQKDITSPTRFNHLTHPWPPVLASCVAIHMKMCFFRFYK